MLESDIITQVTTKLSNLDDDSIRQAVEQVQSATDPVSKRAAFLRLYESFKESVAFVAALKSAMKLGVPLISAIDEQPFYALISLLKDLDPTHPIPKRFVSDISTGKVLIDSRYIVRLFAYVQRESVAVFREIPPGESRYSRRYHLLNAMLMSTTYSTDRIIELMRNFGDAAGDAFSGSLQRLGTKPVIALTRAYVNEDYNPATLLVDVYRRIKTHNLPFPYLSINDVIQGFVSAHTLVYQTGDLTKHDMRWWIIIAAAIVLRNSDMSFNNSFMIFSSRRTALQALRDYLAQDDIQLKVLRMLMRDALEGTVDSDDLYDYLSDDLWFYQCCQYIREAIYDENCNQIQKMCSEKIRLLYNRLYCTSRGYRPLVQSDDDSRLRDRITLKMVRMISADPGTSQHRALNAILNTRVPDAVFANAFYDFLINDYADWIKWWADSNLTYLVNALLHNFAIETQIFAGRKDDAAAKRIERAVQKGFPLALETVLFDPEAKIDARYTGSYAYPGRNDVKLNLTEGTLLTIALRHYNMCLGESETRAAWLRVIDFLLAHRDCQHIINVPEKRSDCTEIDGPFELAAMSQDSQLFEKIVVLGARPVSPTDTHTAMDVIDRLLEHYLDFHNTQNEATKRVNIILAELLNKDIPYVLKSSQKLLSKYKSLGLLISKLGLSTANARHLKFIVHLTGMGVYQAMQLMPTTKVMSQALQLLHARLLKQSDPVFTLKLSWVLMGYLALQGRENIWVGIRNELKQLLAHVDALKDVWQLRDNAIENMVGTVEDEDEEGKPLQVLIDKDDTLPAAFVSGDYEAIRDALNSAPFVNFNQIVKVDGKSISILSFLIREPQDKNKRSAWRAAMLALLDKMQFDINTDVDATHDLYVVLSNAVEANDPDLVAALLKRRFPVKGRPLMDAALCLSNTAVADVLFEHGLSPLYDRDCKDRYLTYIYSKVIGLAANTALLSTVGNVESKVPRDVPRLIPVILEVLNDNKIDYKSVGAWGRVCQYLSVEVCFEVLDGNANNSKFKDILEQFDKLLDKPYFHFGYRILVLNVLRLLLNKYLRCEDTLLPYVCSAFFKVANRNEFSNEFSNDFFDQTPRVREFTMHGETHHDFCTVVVYLDRCTTQKQNAFLDNALNESQRLVFISIQNAHITVYRYHAHMVRRNMEGLHLRLSTPHQMAYRGIVDALTSPYCSKTQLKQAILAALPFCSDTQYFRSLNTVLVAANDPDMDTLVRIYANPERETPKPQPEQDISLHEFVRAVQGRFTPMYNEQSQEQRGVEMSSYAPTAAARND